MPITVRLLETGYWHVRGKGPCNWAQWPRGRKPTVADVFPEASQKFIEALLHWADKACIYDLQSGATF